MKTKRININNIPSIIWGEKSKKIFIAVHGNMSNKEDEVIKILANKAVELKYQVLSFDLPEHGERKNCQDYLCNAQNCVSDLKQIIRYAKDHYEQINIWACSMGAYFSLLACKDEDINKCLFLSPVVDMKTIIDNLMVLCNINEKNLKEKLEIKTVFGQTLYWDYYTYVKNNPIIKWDKKTYILYGKNDNLQNENIIRDFCKRFNCNLSILDNGEHYFHTKEQLNFYENWLDSIIKI